MRTIELTPEERKLNAVRAAKLWILSQQNREKRTDFDGALTLTIWRCTTFDGSPSYDEVKQAILELVFR